MVGRRLPGTDPIVEPALNAPPPLEVAAALGNQQRPKAPSRRVRLDEVRYDTIEPVAVLHLASVITGPLSDASGCIVEGLDGTRDRTSCQLELTNLSPASRHRTVGVVLAGRRSGAPLCASIDPAREIAAARWRDADVVVGVRPV
jgi:hypothetical protein